MAAAWYCAEYTNAIVKINCIPAIIFAFLPKILFSSASKTLFSFPTGAVKQIMKKHAALQSTINHFVQHIVFNSKNAVIIAEIEITIHLNCVFAWNPPAYLLNGKKQMTNRTLSQKRFIIIPIAKVIRILFTMLFPCCNPKRMISFSSAGIHSLSWINASVNVCLIFLFCLIF